jgi:hypothetical protein
VAGKPKQIVPIPPDRFAALSAADKTLHLETLGREAMRGQAKWIERTGSFNKYVREYQEAKNQTARRAILQKMGEDVQNRWVKKYASSTPKAKAPRMTVRDAFNAAKASRGGGSTGSGGGGGGPRGTDEKSVTQ